MKNDRPSVNRQNNSKLRRFLSGDNKKKNNLARTTSVSAANNKSKQKYLAVNEFKNGIYQGNTNNGLRSGLGVYLWDSGEFFFGKAD